MSDKYVIMVGSACIDENYNAERWPQLGDKALIHPTGDLVGGMIANAACVLAGYGVRTAMFDALNSRQSDFILKDLAGYGLDVSHVRIDDRLPDAKCIIIRTGEDRAILVVNGPKPKIRLNDAELAFFEGAAYVYTTPSEMRGFEEPVALMDRLRAKGVRFVMDVESSTYIPEDAPLLERTSLLFFNEFGFERCRGSEAPDQYIHRLFDCGVECVTVTMGADGSETWTPDDHDRTPGRRVPVLDTTGAGDTFNSSFLYAVYRGMDIHRAAAFANAAASDSVTRVGPKTGVGTVERVYAMLGWNQDM